jgi:hypothetical protein
MMNLPNYSTYIPAPSSSHYKRYLSDDIMIYLRYSDSGMKYFDAKSFCNNEGGDLIRIDSADKFNIFKAFLSKSNI